MYTGFIKFRKDVEIMSKTLRLLMPQWQGGNNPPYYFGAKLLTWLAPGSENTPVAEIPVEPCDGDKLPETKEPVGKEVLLKQLKSATKIIEAHQPDRIIMFGGDCLVSQAPFSYLMDKYKEDLGVLWLDAHPDVSTPDMFNHIHAMVLGNLLGEGEPDFAKEVKTPLDPKRVMYGGLQETTREESEIVDRLKIRRAGPEDLKESSLPILDWIRENQIKYLAVHLDLDVLNPELFRSLLFANPNQKEPIDAAQGAMSFSQLARIFKDVEECTEMVGLGIAEYFPWDAINLHKFLDSISIFHS